MSQRYSLVGLFCLGWLLAAGCAPVKETEPLTATRVVPASPVAAVVTPSVSPTTTMTPTPTPLSATEVWQTRAAHQTPLPLAPSATPTIVIPTPTFTPIPGPVWRILFQAVPCPEYLSICDNDLGMSYSSRWYVINSDGSDLIPLKETDTFLADMWGVPRLSPDGMRLAYLARSQADEKLHLMLAEISSGSVTDLGPSPEVARELGFSSEPDCLLVYTTPRPEEAQEIQALTVTKVCAGSSTWEVLATIEFPTLPTMHTYLSDPLLSPNGDAFLITSRNTDDIRELYIYELGSPEPPRLLFAAENESWRINLIYWQSDGQHIEFFLQRWEVDDTVTILHYVSERNGANMRADLELTLPFSINGDWSPDHREIAFFSGMTVYTPAATGIYILDLETGVWRQILSGFYNDTSHIQSWQVDIP